MGKSISFPYHGEDVNLVTFHTSRVEVTSSGRVAQSNIIIDKSLANLWQILKIDYQKIGDVDLEVDEIKCSKLLIVFWSSLRSKRQEFGALDIRLHTVNY